MRGAAALTLTAVLAEPWLVAERPGVVARGFPDMGVRQRPGVCRSGQRFCRATVVGAGTIDEGGVHRARTARAAVSGDGALNPAREGCTLAPPHVKAHHQEENYREEIRHRFRRRARRGQRGSHGRVRREPAKKRPSAHVCVLLPDTKSSVRWRAVRPAHVHRSASRRPGVSHTIVNAEGDAQKMLSQADQCLANGAKVVHRRPARRRLGAARSAERRGHAARRSIDYDRLNTGCKGADYYVSFDNPTVGKFMGRGVARRA